MTGKFNWTPVDHREAFAILRGWMDRNKLGVIEGGAMTGKYTQEKIERGALLYRYWWMRGLQAQAWDDGASFGVNRVPSIGNPAKYDPIFCRSCRSVAGCFDGPSHANPFIGAKRRKR